MRFLHFAKEVANHLFPAKGGKDAVALDIVRLIFVVAVDGEEVSSYDDLQEKMNYYAVGDTVKLTVMRANGNQYKEKEIEVTLCSYDDLNKLIGKSR